MKQNQVKKEFVFSGNSIGPKNKRGLSTKQVLAHDKQIRREKSKFKAMLDHELS